MDRSSHSGSAAPHPVETPAPVLLPSQVLDKAADLIEPEGAWTQGVYGLDERGLLIAPGDPGVCYCASGAVWRVVGAGRWSAWQAAVDAFRGVTGRHFGPFNDVANRTQAEVVAAFRKAADLARQEEAGSTPDTPDHGADGEAGSEQQ